MHLPVYKGLLAYAFLCTILLLLLRKFWLGYYAISYVKSCKHQINIELMKTDSQFSTTIKSLSSTEPSIILILNSFALNMTLNWLCNTKYIKGVHERCLIVTLDITAYQDLSTNWPNVRRVLWNVPCLQQPFNYGDGHYQLFSLFRSTLAELLVEYGKPFWMIQQDTFWRRSILDVDISATQDADLLFDRAGENLGQLIADICWDCKTITFDKQTVQNAKKNDNLLAKNLENRADAVHNLRPSFSNFSLLILKMQSGVIIQQYNFSSIYRSGGYYMARPTSRARNFFRQLSENLTWRYVPDNTFMTVLCAVSGAKCDHIPYSVVTNWVWIYQPSLVQADYVPYLIQFDGDTKLSGKLEKMKSIGFYFLSTDGVTCNSSAFEAAMKSVASRKINEDTSQSFNQFGLKYYTMLINIFLRSPITESFLYRVVYPNAYYFMLSV